MIGSIVVMLNKGSKARLAEGVDEAGELYRSISGAGNDSHLTQVLYGGGAALVNSAGVPWMSQGGAEVRGPWNDGEQWDVISDREQQMAVDGGDGSASVQVNSTERALLDQMAARTRSDPDSDPLTGAELGAGLSPDLDAEQRGQPGMNAAVSARSPFAPD